MKRPSWPKRKLTEHDGERILWHVLDHLYRYQDVPGCDPGPESVPVIRALLDSFYRS
jgi:hypothetical protein